MEPRYCIICGRDMSLDRERLTMNDFLYPTCRDYCTHIYNTAGIYAPNEHGKTELYLEPFVVDRVKEKKGNCIPRGYQD